MAVQPGWNQPRAAISWMRQHLGYFLPLTGGTVSGNFAVTGTGAISGNATVSGNATLEGELIHTGAKIGFFGKSTVAQQVHVADPTGGSTVDSQSRTAIAAILDALEAVGINATS